MDERQVIQSLLKRAHARREQRHHHNESGLSAPQCLGCGAAACRAETRAPLHLFCVQQACQRGFHALQGVFYQFGVDPPVGGKRVVPVWEERRFQGWHYFPDEVLCLIILQAFDAALEDAVQYNELMAMRNVSPQFSSVIDNCVVQQIQVLGDEVTSALSVEELMRFRALRGLILILPELGGADASRLLAALPALEHLTLAGSDDGERITGPLPQRIHDLRLSGVTTEGLPDAAVQALTLSELRINDNHERTDAVLAGQSTLKTLVLEHTRQIRDLSPCVSLECLFLGARTQASLDTLGALTSLTQLSVARGSHTGYSDAWLATNTGMRHLSMRAQGAGVTDAGLRPLVGLESLLVYGERAITPDAMSRLTNLTALGLYRGGQDFTEETVAPLQRTVVWLAVPNDGMSAAVLRGFANLQYLDLTFADLDDNDPAAPLLRGMPQLLELYINQTTGLRGSGFRWLTALRKLDISNNNEITDANLVLLAPTLEELNLDDNKRITDAAVKQMTHLTRLSLNFNTRVTYNALALLTQLEEVSIFRSTLSVAKRPKVTTRSRGLTNEQNIMDALERGGTVFVDEYQDPQHMSSKSLAAWADYPYV